MILVFAFIGALFVLSVGAIIDRLPERRFERIIGFIFRQEALVDEEWENG